MNEEFGRCGKQQTAMAIDDCPNDWAKQEASIAKQQGERGERANERH